MTPMNGCQQRPDPADGSSIHSDMYNDDNRSINSEGESINSINSENRSIDSTDDANTRLTAEMEPITDTDTVAGSARVASLAPGKKQPTCRRNILRPKNKVKPLPSSME